MTAVTREERSLSAAAHAAVRLFATDVLTGFRQVSHNALALLGLAAVALVVFLAGRDDMRAGLEGRVLTWLTERANARTELVASAQEQLNGVLLAMAEPEAIQRATASDPAELSRQQSAVVYWLSRRYSVAPEPVSRLVQEAWNVGRQVGLDPSLILAVMAVESGFNPFAQSHVGAQGLMQVMTRVHQDKYQIFGGRNAAFDPVTNLRVGAQVLKECIQRAGSLAGGLKYYVGAANMAYDGGYSAKVLAEQGYLRQIANGHKVAVTAPLPQATMVSSVPAAEDAARPAQAAPVAPAASAHQPDEHAPVLRRPEQVALAP
ncbi:transglycosylase SLT domain-containing protein [Aquabacterium sp.]|uniref:lytic transglycosylase domain-containing protein n=1 Tax=Aquabacterium sp. TaxID=1872578 RepID=UPI0035B15CE4